MAGTQEFDGRLYPDFGPVVPRGTLTAADFQWRDYTPVATGTTTDPTTSTADGRYLQIGTLVHVAGHFEFSAAGSGALRMTVPVPVANAIADTVRVGTADFSLTGDRHIMRVYRVSASVVGFILDRVTALTASEVASGDNLWWNLTYEAA